MATTTVTRADGSTVTLSGAWGDQAATDNTNSLPLNPRSAAQNNDDAVFSNVTQITTQPQVANVANVITGITVTPTSQTLAPNATHQITVTDSNSATVPASACTFTTSDATKATVSASGLIRAVADGTATITTSYAHYTARDPYTATTAVTVTG